jgi:TolB protein
MLLARRADAVRPMSPRPRPSDRRAHVAGLLLASAVGAACADAQPPARRDTIPAGVSVRLTYDPRTRPGVAVLPVKGADGDSIRAILQRDLDFGDRVTVLTGRAADAPALPDGRVSYELARTLGALAVVQVAPAAGGVRVTVHDVARQGVLTARDFALPSASSPGWRLAVHGVSDELERWITGVRGVAATRILFVRERRVWVVDSDGENARPVSAPGALSPAWHPGGTAFVHSVLEDDGRQRIVARTLAGDVRTLAATRVTNITPTVSPDGRTVIFAHGEEEGTDLYAVPFEGGGARRVTVGRGSDNVSPTFAPDGRRLAFASGRSGHPEVYIADADGTGAELLTDYEFGTQNYRSNPDWSPDGRSVAFQSLVGGVFQVMTLELRNRSTKQLTRDGRNEDPSWAPDARHLVHTSTRGGSSQLWIVDAETGRARQLTRGAPARMAAWSPSLTGRP